MTGIISRRSLYYSRDASSDHSVVRFATAYGNLPFIPTEHSFGPDGKCSVCRAPRTLDRGDKRENHAYSFIHGTYPTEEMADVQFDVIVGNPPYQLDDGGHNASATPIYQHFVNMAIDMAPKYVVMITPSRWFSGGKGLGPFRAKMINDHRLRILVDYPKLYDGFPGVKIRGGVSYFLWSRDEPGPCRVQTMWDGKPVGAPVTRYLDAYDVVIRRNEAVSILEKVRAIDDFTTSNLASRVSSNKPFGLRTYFHGQEAAEGLTEPVKLYGSQRTSWIERSQIPVRQEWVDDWKVLMSRVQGTSAAVETQFLSRPIIAAPGEACTETYVVAGRFEHKAEAQRYAAYLRTRFLRFLVSLRKVTQDAPKGVYAFVPNLPTDRYWTDELLYERYGITPDEIAFIESQVAAMLPDGNGDDE
jgi:site-specific DNA-methyltransferase (adenine-specific)